MCGKLAFIGGGFGGTYLLDAKFGSTDSLLRPFLVPQIRFFIQIRNEGR
jgi:hypothetical protein